VVLLSSEIKEYLARGGYKLMQGDSKLHGCGDLRNNEGSGLRGRGVGGFLTVKNGRLPDKPEVTKNS
jgi:NADH:ubiquinone oxidoreductase subunit F (NADH-binding)